MSDKVVSIRDAVKGAKPAAPRRKRGGGDGAHDAPPPPPGDGFHGPPKRLPPNAPVQALGRLGRNYYFLDAAGQFLCLQDKDIVRNAIIGLFGGNEYLIQTWPAYDKEGKRLEEFKHGLLSPVLIASCHDKGLWDPEENVRGVGAWKEDDGTLVMHCGDRLFLSSGLVLATGLRDRLLYPAAPAMPHPEFGRAGDASAAAVLLEKLKSWNWTRGRLENDVDAKMLIGWMIHAFLGAAPDWRPVVWITGGTGTGKSTLMKLVRWIFGERAMVRSEDASAAGIKHRVRDTSLPVSIDELESEEDNRRQDDIVKLARIAASGGETLRGMPGGGSLTFVARNCFIFSSILIQSLRQQDKNRMAILSLERVEWEGAAPAREPGEDEAADDEDSILGAKAEWERIGRQLRGRALAQWPRYLKTWRLYRRALEAAGHTARGADQFGALGAGYDCAMYDAIDEGRAAEWARVLPGGRLAETTGYEVNERACLKELLGAQIEAWRGGVKESVARLLRGAKEELADRSLNERPQAGALEQIGIRVFRDRRDITLWRVAISHTHPAIARIFAGTDWKGRRGSPGAWAQALDRLPNVERSARGGSPRLRIDGDLHYVTVLHWDTVFPPIDAAGADADFVELVSEEDTGAGERERLV